MKHTSLFGFLCVQAQRITKCLCNSPMSFKRRCALLHGRCCSLELVWYFLHSAMTESSPHPLHTMTTCGERNVCHRDADMMVSDDELELQVQDLSGRFAESMILPFSLMFDKRGVREHVSAILQVPAHTLHFSVPLADASPYTVAVSAFNFVQRDHMLENSIIHITLLSMDVGNARFYGEECMVCGDTESDRTMSWARSDSDSSEFDSGKTCKCEWSVAICDRCMVMNDDFKMVCPQCRDLDLCRISDSRHRKWFSNVIYFTKHCSELHEALGWKGVTEYVCQPQLPHQPTGWAV